jgi:hypothetical protein
MNVADLRQELRERGLSATGNKNELAARLRQAVIENSSPPQVMQPPQVMPAGTTTTPPISAGATTAGAALQTVPTTAPGRASVKLPEFNFNNIPLWFMQVECQFDFCNVVHPRTRYSCVAASLPPQVGQAVEDIIFNSSTFADPYVTLKEAIIKRLGINEDQRMHRLLHGEQLGDRRPSELLRALNALRHNAPEDSTLRALFLDRLPQHIKLVLISHTSQTLNELADIADRMMAVGTVPVPTVVQAATLSPTEAGDPSCPTLAAIRDLTQEIRKFGTRSSKPRQETDPQGRCWYHSTFGAKAKKCSSPCTWKGNAPAGH